MRLKDGASVKGVRWEMFYAALIVEAIYNRFGFIAWITAGTDGQHKANSLHYVGLALDFRTRDIPPSLIPRILKEIRLALGPDYDVIFEAHPGHFHVEFDPKGTRV